jgi:hypothetical protein
LRHISLNHTLANGYTIYTTKSGDTLQSIAKEFYGDENEYGDISELNNLYDNDQILPGVILALTFPEVVKARIAQHIIDAADELARNKQTAADDLARNTETAAWSTRSAQLASINRNNRLIKGAWNVDWHQSTNVVTVNQDDSWCSLSIMSYGTLHLLHFFKSKTTTNT